MATKPNHSTRYWDTEKEQIWLNEMPKRIPEPDRQQAFITGYLTGCEKRTEWSGMDKKVIVKTAQAMQVAA